MSRKQELVKNRIWEGLKLGFLRGEFAPHDVDELEIGFSDYFWENFNDCMYCKADSIWGDLEGFDDVDMDFGDFLENFFVSKKELDPISQLFLTKFIAIDVADKQLTEIGFSGSDMYLGVREVNGEPRHHFRVSASYKAKNGRTSPTKVEVYFCGEDQKEFDELMQDCYLTDYGTDHIEDFVDNSFDWYRFERDLAAIAAAKLEGYREEQQRKLEKKKVYNEDLQTYHNLQAKLRRAGVL